MEPVHEATPARHNHLIARLPEPVQARVVEPLEPVDLPVGHVLAQRGRETTHFYFVTRGFVSLLYTTEDGHSAEISIVGNEGGIGLGLILGGHPMPTEAVVQATGFAWRMPADALRREFARGGALQRNLLRFTQALMTQMAQTAVCNRHHSVEMQLCRWILLSLDRLHGRDLWMTQEMIAHMLGVRRAGVTEAAARLQRDGLIEYSRGHIHVPDPAALAAHACECYGVVKHEYELLFA